METPPLFNNYDEETQQKIHCYLSQLTDIQKKAYLIAIQHLGSSFNIVKSNGYIQWLQKE